MESVLHCCGLPATSLLGKRHNADSTILDSILNELEATVKDGLKKGMIDGFP